MNPFTVLCLSLGTVKQAPFLSLPLSHLTHFNSPFMTSDGHLTRFPLTRFSCFLSSSIRFDQSLSSPKEFTTPSSFNLDVVDLEQCAFSSITSSAITSSVLLTLYNCIFTRCESSSTGGAVATNSSLVLSFVTANSCSARFGGVLHQSYQRECSLSINLCLFANASAHYFGALYRNAPGEFTLDSTNMSHLKVEHCVGCMEVKGGSLSMRFSVIEDSVARAHNGAVCTRELTRTLFERCIWAHCKHVSNESDAAAALLIYENPTEAALLYSNFVDNDPWGTYTITVVTGRHLIMTGCWFTGLYAKEVHEKNIAVEICKFKQTSFPLIDFLAAAQGYRPGFNAAMKKMPATRPARPTAMWSFVFDLRAQLTMLAIACIIGAVISAGVVAVDAGMRKVCRAAVRVPRAII
jgi:hypothetical protein